MTASEGTFNREIFDLEGVMDRVDNDVELFDEIRDIFFEDYEESTSKIGSAIETQNFEELERAAHSMKSASGNIGAQKAFETAFQMETLGRSGREGTLDESSLHGKKPFEWANELYEQFKQQIADYQKEVQKWQQAQ